MWCEVRFVEIVELVVASYWHFCDYIKFLYVSSDSCITKHRQSSELPQEILEVQLERIQRMEFNSYSSK